MKVTAITVKYGFSSLSYFSSAFTDYFNASPRAWREGAYLEKFPRQYLHSKRSKQLSNNKEEKEEKQPYNQFQWIDLSKIKTVILPEETFIVQQ